MNRDLFGIPVGVNPQLPKDCIVFRDGLNPIVEVENESLMDTLYRAIDSDAGFLKKCGVIVRLGDLRR